MHKDIKKAIYHKDYCASESSRVIENMFNLNDETASLINAANVSYDNRKLEESVASDRPSVGTRSQRNKQSSGERATKCSTNSDQAETELKRTKDQYLTIPSSNSRK